MRACMCAYVFAYPGGRPDPLPTAASPPPRQLLPPPPTPSSQYTPILKMHIFTILFYKYEYIPDKTILESVKRPKTIDWVQTVIQFWQVLI